MGLEYLSTVTINSSHSWIGKRPSPWGTHICHILCKKHAPFSMPGDLTGRAWRSWRFLGLGIGYRTPIQRTIEGTSQKITQTSVPFDDPNPEQQDLFICWVVLKCLSKSDQIIINIGYVGHISSHSPTFGLIFDLCGKYIYIYVYIGIWI